MILLWNCTSHDTLQYTDWWQLESLQHYYVNSCSRACLHEHSNTSYAVVAGKNLLMTSDYSWMWTSGCWQVLQLYGCDSGRDPSLCFWTWASSGSSFLKIGSFKKKKNHKHTSNVVLWMACKCFRCSRQKQTKNLVNRMGIFEWCILKVRNRIWWQKNKDVWHMSVSAICLSVQSLENL